MGLKVFFRVIFLTLASCASADVSQWERVYLASFPRSGNHWVRFLVEEASHIVTSSVYKDSDYPHLSRVFPWGGYCTDHGYAGNCRYPKASEAVLLKTHYPHFSKSKLLEPTRAVKICLIRHPLDALYSFYVYQQKKMAVSAFFLNFYIKWFLSGKVFMNFGRRKKMFS